MSQRNYQGSQFQVAELYSVTSSQNAVTEKPHPGQMSIRYNRAGFHDFVVQPGMKGLPRRRHSPAGLPQGGRIFPEQSWNIALVDAICG
jgi:hypothetical protein